MLNLCPAGIASRVLALRTPTVLPCGLSGGRPSLRATHAAPVALAPASGVSHTVPVLLELAEAGQARIRRKKREKPLEIAITM
jgi:hypothetical protein